MIRTLDPINDEDLLIQADGWAADKPKWWRLCSSVWPSSLSYFDRAKRENQVDFGIFNDDLCGLITLEEYKPAHFEAHIDAPRATNLEILIRATIDVSEHIRQKGAKSVFTLVAGINKPIINLCRETGFVETNVRIINGNIGKKLIEWREFILNY